MRSLSWGDRDYDGLALEFIVKMINAHPENLGTIQEYVSTKCPDFGECISSHAEKARRIVFAPMVFKVPSLAPDRSLISVMMPFDQAMTPVYEAIHAAARSSGFACKRVDDIWDDTTVIQDVFSLIFESYIVVCDFSGRNPNVFYEAGIARTLGKYVVPITQHANDIPFDLKHHRYARYLNNREGREKLHQELSERFKTLADKRQL